MEHFDQIVKDRSVYAWKDKTMVESVRDRNMIQASIVKSRIRNNGGIDLDTLDGVMDWGGMRRFALDED